MEWRERDQGHIIIDLWHHIHVNVTQCVDVTTKSFSCCCFTPLHCIAFPLRAAHSSVYSPTDRYPILAHCFVVQQYLYSSVSEIYVQGIGREMQMPSSSCHCPSRGRSHGTRAGRLATKSGCITPQYVRRCRVASVVVVVHHYRQGRSCPTSSSSAASHHSTGRSS